MEALAETNYNFKGGTFYKGKVRDVYRFTDRIAIVATDRISAFDMVLGRAIPYKGQVLNQLAAFFLQMTAPIVPNWLEKVPHANVAVGRYCMPYPVEMVVRGYLAGHAWREYKAGKRQLCGVDLPEGLKENDRLPQPIITPTTKAAEGHDEDISREQIFEQKLVPEADYQQLEQYSLALFARGQQYANSRGLILVDTKYEFGQNGEQIMLIDEVHTPDSSRYFYLEGYDERQQRGEAQKQLSKEFVRQWLIEHNFQGKEGQHLPELPDAFVKQVSKRYIELYQLLTGQRFQPISYTNILDDIEQSIRQQIILKTQ